MTDVRTPHLFSPGPLRGSIDVPGDKSISHRALILGAAAPDPVRIFGLNQGRDVRATLEALLALGIRIEGRSETVTVHGAPLREPLAALDCMNSGSTARMMLGVCAGANVRATFEGDESLSRRPMEPVAAQLRAFGAKIDTTDGHLPMRILGTPDIETRRFILLSPSAQVKSALLFAGLFAKNGIEVLGDRGSRDHTERMIRYLGGTIDWNGERITLHGSLTRNDDIVVPGDFSAAAFFIVAATIAPESELTIRNVNVNRTRTGLLDALGAMGANIELLNEREQCGEPTADVMVRSASLRPTSIGPDVALRAIDEIPALAVAAAFAPGDTKITGVRELRTKESDRLAAIERMLAAAGIGVEIATNSIIVRGGAPRAEGASVDTQHDHRIAMSTATLAAGAGPIGVDSDASIGVSFPAFIQTLRSVQEA